MFWTNKYCPQTLTDIVDVNTHYFHKQIAEQVLVYFNKEKKNLFEHPTIFLNGPISSGRWTYAQLILQQLFGNSIYSTRRKRIQINNSDPPEIITSSHHCEFYDTLFLHYKPHIFHQILISLGESKNIYNSGIPFYILCKNIDKWTLDYHKMIKNAIEKYPDTLRFIVTSSKHIPQIIHQSSLFRIPQPQINEMITCLKHICKMESIDFTKTIEQKVIQKIHNSVDSSYQEILLWFQEKTISGSWRNVKKVKQVELKHVINLLFSSNSLNTLLELRELLLECIAFGKLEKLSRYVMDKICRHPSLSQECISDCISIITKFDTRIKLHHRNHIHYEGMIYELFYCIHHKDYNKLNTKNNNCIMSEKVL